MELVPVSTLNNQENQFTAIGTLATQTATEVPIRKKWDSSPFIEANTSDVSLFTLQNECIIPVFSKDNERTIAHQEFIEIAGDCASKVFSEHAIDIPEIRVSHPIKGRTPEAIHKAAKDLEDHERTQYFERMAFVIRIPSITETINGNELSLIVGGVRAYNRENLYSRKTIEKFRIFIGFQNMVCCNLCVSTDGFQSEIRVSSYNELEVKLKEMIQNYQIRQHLDAMKNLTQYQLSEHQFAQLLGKTRLYNHLPKEIKAEIPALQLNDGQMATIAKDYYGDIRFCKEEDSNINLWNVFNLFTSANKSSYIDTFLGRNVNAYSFTQGLAKTLDGDNRYQWFLS